MSALHVVFLSDCEPGCMSHKWAIFSHSYKERREGNHKWLVNNTCFTFIIAFEMMLLVFKGDFCLNTRLIIPPLLLHYRGLGYSGVVCQRTQGHQSCEQFQIKPYGKSLQPTFYIKSEFLWSAILPDWRYIKRWVWFDVSQLRTTRRTWQKMFWVVRDQPLCCARKLKLLNQLKSH